MAGKKYDSEKPRTDLIPPSMIFDVAEVLTHGADKYGDRNWEDGLEYSRLFGAVQRHLWDWYRGNDIDDDSGLNALKHALTGLAMLNHMRYIHPELDDRPNEPKKRSESKEKV